MRLSKRYISVILETAQRQFGKDSQVWLFGSRTDDSCRGGDIDLMLEVRHSIRNKPREAAKFSAALQMKLGDQKFDIFIDDGKSSLPIYQAVRANGRKLSW